MKIKLIGEPEIIMQGENNPHNYFAWPSVAKLKNGKIAISSSGFRLAHVCPFGKAVMAFSEDNGKSYTKPAPIIDTCLDDRDSGLCPFGKSGLIVTSFNNTVQFQRENALKVFKDDMTEKRKKYTDAYLDLITPEEEKRDLGANFRVSFDNGTTFGPIYKSPITSPHGPTELADGTILWVGRTFSNNDAMKKEDLIKAYKIDVNTGKMEYLGQIEPVFADGKKILSCEPHATQLSDGRIICHFRVQRNEGVRIYTTYQSESPDGGKTWTKPKQILEITGGAPAHLLEHSSGVLISTYGYRDEPYGIKVKFSTDGGKTFGESKTLYTNELTPDLGYPETVELEDKTLLTVFYAHPEKNSPAAILQQKWRIEE